MKRNYTSLGHFLFSLPSKGVEKCDDLGSSELESGPLHWLEVERVRIFGSIKRAREEDLESRAKPLDLELAPDFALVASDAIHDAADVAEMVAEFVL